MQDLGGLDNVLKRAPGDAIPERALAAMAFQMVRCSTHCLPCVPPMLRTGITSIACPLTSITRAL